MPYNHGRGKRLSESANPYRNITIGLDFFFFFKSKRSRNTCEIQNNSRFMNKPSVPSEHGNQKLVQWPLAIASVAKSLQEKMVTTEKNSFLQINKYIRVIS